MAAAELGIVGRVKDAWQILGLEPDSTLAQVKANYARLLRQHRPDVDPEGFRELRDAYEVLRGVLESGGDPSVTWVALSADVAVGEPHPAGVEGHDADGARDARALRDGSESPATEPAAETVERAIAAIAGGRFDLALSLLTKALSADDPATARPLIAALAERAGQPMDPTASGFETVVRGVALLDVAIAERLTNLVFRAQPGLPLQHVEALLAAGREVRTSDREVRAFLQRVLTGPPAEVTDEDVGRVVALMRRWRGSKPVLQQRLHERFPGRVRAVALVAPKRPLNRLRRSGPKAVEWLRMVFMLIAFLFASASIVRNLLHLVQWP